MKQTTRRNFIKKTSAAAAGISVFAPFSIGRPGDSPNNKIHIAAIGVGGRGSSNLGACDKENIVALCDVDENNAKKNFAKYEPAKKFKDFRVMMDKMGKEIDAVLVSTPDHTHFCAAMAAMQQGKHVYVEKPLAHNVWELRTLRKAAHKYNVITQMGNQGHATDGIRRIKEWYEAGVLGEVREVFAWFDHPNFGSRYFSKPDRFPPRSEEIPETLEFDLLLGPAEKRPFNSCYVPRRWRGWYDFGNGILGDWACHTLDGPFWALDLGMPSVAEADFATQA
ncbi:twin-arginine translocation signal domain-containing protein, partial [bacterium]|nr:twin-arginine translocation signal domain-containing protein [bacterium]